MRNFNTYIHLFSRIEDWFSLHQFHSTMFDCRLSRWHVMLQVEVHYLYLGTLSR